MEWLYARDTADETPLVVTEMAAAFAGRTDADKHLLLAALKDKMRQASLGALAFPDDVDWSRQDPDIWELRWEIDDMLYRLYFGEPVDDSTILVALLFHFKGKRGGKVMSSREQTRLHKRAVKRYHEGKASNWGASSAH